MYCSKPDFIFQVFFDIFIKKLTIALTAVCAVCYKTFDSVRFAFLLSFLFKKRKKRHTVFRRMSGAYLYKKIQLHAFGNGDFKRSQNILHDALHRQAKVQARLHQRFVVHADFAGIVELVE